MMYHASDNTGRVFKTPGSIVLNKILPGGGNLQLKGSQGMK